MTLRYYYRDNDGDVVEIVNPSRIRRGGTDASYQAEEGAVGTWELEVDDPDGTFNVRGFRIVYVQEDAAVADDQHGIIGVWYTGERYVSRLGSDSPAKRTGRGRTWRIQLHDLNTRLSWRLNVGNDCDRPAETDLARIAWLMGTNEMSWLDDDTTYVDSTAAVDMDAVDYTGQALLDVVDDCGQQSGRNYGLLWEYSGSPSDPVAIKLWYKFGASTDYSSTRLINNIDAEVREDLDVLYPSLDATLNRSPSRVAWGVYQAYDGGAVYQTNAVTAERFNKIDVVGRGENVKTAAQAAYRANRYLSTVSNVETDRIEVSVIVDPEDVNSILPFHRIQVHFTHLPGYQGEADDDYFWMRVVERTVRDRDPFHYELGLTLMAPSLDEFPADQGGGDVDATLRAYLLNESGPYPLPAGPLLFGRNGDQTAAWLTTIGPFDFVASDQDNPEWYGIEVTADGIVSAVQMEASAIGVALGVNDPYIITFQLLLNEVVLDERVYTINAAGASSLWGGSVTLAATNVTVSNGDVFNASLSCIGADGFHMEGFRSPIGIEPGYLFVKGGIF